MTRERRLAAIEKRTPKKTHGKVVIYCPELQPRPAIGEDTFVIEIVSAEPRQVAAVALPHNYRDPLP